MVQSYLGCLQRLLNQLMGAVKEYELHGTKNHAIWLDKANYTVVILIYHMDKASLPVLATQGTHVLLSPSDSWPSETTLCFVVQHSTCLLHYLMIVIYMVNPFSSIFFYLSTQTIRPHFSSNFLIFLGSMVCLLYTSRCV